MIEEVYTMKMYYEEPDFDIIQFEVEDMITLSGTDFMNKVEPGDIIVAGRNFGCGSSREHAPIVIKESGISLVIAKSFARIFYRNAINIGLAIIECPECIDEMDEGDKVRVDFDKGEIVNETKNKTYKASPFPPFIQTIIQNGGLINSIKNNAFGG
jgi:3-isopropylmalate/(R)-2-methylmalate dehydratase small subunit